MARLGDVCIFQSGGTPSKSNDAYFGGTIPWITTVALNGSVIGNENAVEWITEQAIAESAAKIVPAKSIMVGTRVGVGKVAINTVPMSTSQDIISLLQIDESRWYKPFLCKFILSQSDYLNSQARGATIKGIKIDVLASLQLPNIPIEQQKRIAAVLDQADTLISLRKQQIAKLDELVKARFVEMFETGQWSTVKASNFMSNMRNGVSPSNSGTISAKVLTLSAITQGIFDKDAWKDGIFDIEPSEDKRISSCDFYMCRGNGNKNLVGSGVYSHENYYDLVFPDTVIAAQIDTSQVMLPFLFHAWKRPFVRSQIEAGARTTNGTYKINQKVIASVEIVHPPLDLQHQFAVFVAQTDQQKLTIQHSLAQLELLKKALMQKYFG